MIDTVFNKLGGHLSTGPTSVSSHGCSLINSPILPPPVTSSGGSMTRIGMGCYFQSKSRESELGG